MRKTGKLALLALLAGLLCMPGWVAATAADPVSEPVAVIEHADKPAESIALPEISGGPEAEAPEAAAEDFDPAESAVEDAAPVDRADENAEGGHAAADGKRDEVAGGIGGADAPDAGAAPLGEDRAPLSLFEQLKTQLAAVPAGGAADIPLAAGEYLFTEILKVDQNRTVRLVSEGAVTFKRDPAFKNTMIEVDAGSALTLDAGSGELVMDAEHQKNVNQNGRGSFIHTEGVLQIDGAAFLNDYDNANVYRAPICGLGESARILFNSGRISGTLYESTAGGGNWYSAGGFIVRDGAELVMNGGSIENNRISTFSYNSYLGYWANIHSAGAVMLVNGSQMTLNGGEIKENKSSTGAILAGGDDIYYFDRQTADPAALRRIPISSFTMNGGKISKNQGVAETGGVHIFGAAEGTLNSGEIVENVGYAGGGVLAMDHYVDGVQGVNQTRAKVSLADWSALYPARFVMNGGQVNRNFALMTGGGITISSDQGELNAGEIRDNIAHDQGGGVYLTATPYTLRIKNAYISQNEASDSKTSIHSGGVMENGELYRLTLGAGGGVWFCPTGDAEVYAENGAVIFDNQAETAGDDFHNEKKVPGHFSVTLPTRMQSGAQLRWYRDDEGNRYDADHPAAVDELKNIRTVMSLKAQLTDGGRRLAEAFSKLFITGNVANKGGGVGSNGSIIFGSRPQDGSLKNLVIKKTWAGVEAREIQIEVGIRRGEDLIPIERLTLNAANGFEAELDELPATVDGQPIETLLYVKEVTAGDFNANVMPIRQVKREMQEVPFKDGAVQVERISFEIAVENTPRPTESTTTTTVPTTTTATTTTTTAPTTTTTAATTTEPTRPSESTGTTPAAPPTLTTTTPGTHPTTTPTMGTDVPPSKPDKWSRPVTTPTAPPGGRIPQTGETAAALPLVLLSAAAALTGLLIRRRRGIAG